MIARLAADDPEIPTDRHNTFKGSRYVIMTLMVPGLTEDALKAPAEKLMKMVLPKL